MIPYIEIINKSSLMSFALIEPSQCWFELSYYETGQFQIYCVANAKNLAALKHGNYVKLPNKRWLWVITSIQYEFAANGARMISATGYEAKWILNKRIIQPPYEMPTSLAQAIYGLVYYNLGAGAVIERQISGLYVELSTEAITIEKTQATRENILTFASNLLKMYKCGCQIIYDNGALKFKMIRGQDKTSTVKFSQSLDNLLTSNYINDIANYGTYALVVSKVEDVDYTKEVNIPKTTNPITYYTGIDRNEILVNSDLSTTYVDVNGDEQTTTPTSVLYQGWQVEEGKKELANHIIIEEANSQIDLVNSNYKFDVDFYIGDQVKTQDEYFNYSIISRVIKYTISQDANGYAEHADFGE